jgi:hypothetical protein
VGTIRNIKPVRQPLSLSAGPHGREGPDEPGERVQFGAVTPDGLELELLGFGEGHRVPEDPTGDGTGARPAGQ